jgi:hypothetical protein
LPLAPDNQAQPMIDAIFLKMAAVKPLFLFNQGVEICIA